MYCIAGCLLCLSKKSKKEGKDQESIQNKQIPIGVTTLQLDITNESQEVSPFPAVDHKESTNRRAYLF